MKIKEYEKLDKHVKVFKICQKLEIKSYKELINYIVEYTPHDPDDSVGAEEDTSLWIFKKEWCPLMKFIIDERHVFIDYFKN